MRIRNEIGMARVIEFLDERLVLLERGHVTFPVHGDELRHGKADGGVMNGGREILRHFQFAELLMEREPSIDGSRHRDRQRSQWWNVILWRQPRAFVGGFDFRGHLREITPAWGSAGAVIAVKLARLRIVDNRKQVAADAV